MRQECLGTQEKFFQDQVQEELFDAWPDGSRAASSTSASAYAYLPDIACTWNTRNVENSLPFTAPAGGLRIARCHKQLEKKS
jgi:hypothetical protein